MRQFDTLWPVAQRVGERIAPHYRGVTTVEDVTQQAFLWLMSHPERVERATTEGVVNRSRIYGEAAWATVEWCNQERRRVLPHAKDDFSYKAVVVEAILPYVWGELSRPIPERVGKSVADPALGGDWLAYRMDVERGLKLLNVTQKQVLFLKFGQDESWNDTADLLDMTVDAARAHRRRGVERLVQFLNGLHPVDARWGGPGSRRAVSNAHAQWLTREAYNPPT